MTTMTKDVLTMPADEFEREARNRLENAQRAARAAADAETIASAAVDEERIRLAGGLGSRSAVTLAQRELAKRQEAGAQAEAAIKAVEREAGAAREARHAAAREQQRASEAAAMAEGEIIRDDAADFVADVRTLLAELVERVEDVQPRLPSTTGRPPYGRPLVELGHLPALLSYVDNIAASFKVRPKPLTDTPEAGVPLETIEGDRNDQ